MQKQKNLFGLPSQQRTTLRTYNVASNAEQYTLTAKELKGNTVQLNGLELKLGSDDELPALKGNSIKSGKNTLPALSISFFTIADASI
jgi:hypothetical protein